METMIKMLFPVDLSGVSPKVVPDVLEMAHKFNAEIHLLYVANTLEQYDTFYVPHPSLDRFEVELHEASERRLLDFEHEFFKDYPYVQRVVLDGKPVETILDYIKSQRIDMVVLGTRGRRGLDRMIFGSIAEQVVKESPVPVLSINPYLKSAGRLIMKRAAPAEIFSYASPDCLNCNASVSECENMCAM